MALRGSSGTYAPPTPIDDPAAARRFAQSQAWESNRDRWGRPKVMLPDGSEETGYRRASSFGSPLEDSYRLDAWKLRQVARGMARSPALRLRATRAERGLESADEEQVKKAKTELDEIAQEAMKAVGSAEKADVGTALHDICEAIDRGEDPGVIPEEWQADVDAYRALIADFDPLDVELIVVQDEFRIGGRLDRIVRTRRDFWVRPMVKLPAGSVILGDQKTAQDMSFAGAKFGCQCFTYTTGIPYDPLDKVREDWGHEPPREDWAVILSTPSGQGTAELYWVDLRAARRATEQAHEAHEWRNKLGRKLIKVSPTPKAHAKAVKDAALAAPTLAVLRELHAVAVECEVWDDKTKAVFTKRRLEIEAGDGVAAVTAGELVSVGA